MKNRILLTTLVIAAALLAGTLLALLDSRIENEKEPSAESSSRSSSTQISESALIVVDEVPQSGSAAASRSQPDGGYWLTVYDGRLAAVRDGQTQPEIIYDVFVRVLPECDRLALEAGIYAATREELDALAEDYIS